MGKDTTAADASADAALAQTKQAQMLLDQTNPLRQGLIQDAGEFLSGDRDVTGLPQFRALKNANEGQFAVAQDNIIANTAEGGGLTAALAANEGARASNQVAFTGDLAQQETDLAAALATGGAVQGGQGLANAGFLQSQNAQAEGAANAGKSSGAGSAAGSAAAAAAVKKAAAVTAAGTGSDRRLKRNIKKIGMYGPHNLYSFEYLSGKRSVGVMAQEMPTEFVSEDSSGFLMVHYRLL
jgi:hypothetical protein